MCDADSKGCRQARKDGASGGARGHGPIRWPMGEGEVKSLVASSGLLVLDAHIAQLVEHFLGKEEVTGSNPVMGSRSR